MIEKIISGAIVKIAYVINLLIGVIAGVTFRIGGVFMEWTLKLNNHILDQANNLFLFTAWQILLNFANLILILGVIVIAFGIIFQASGYGTKKMLVRLIVVALLINFSLVISGVFIDMAGVLTNYFVVNSKLGPMEMSAALAGAFDISSLFDIASKDPNNQGQVFGPTLTNASMVAIGSIFFVTLFTMISAIVLLAISFMFFMRYLWLSFLLALTPIVFVCWIFPFSQKWWKQWWNKFTQWTVFAPLMTFMLYLTISSLKLNANRLNVTGAADTIKQSTFGVENGAAGQSLQSGLYFGIGSLMQMGMTIGLLIGSLMVANHFSIAGAKTFQGWAEGAYKGVGDWAKRKGIQAGTSPLRNQKVQEKLGDWQKTGSASSWPFRKLTLPIRRGAELASKAGMKPVESSLKQAADKVGKMKPQEIANKFKDFTAEERVAALEKFVKDKGKGMDKIDPRVLDEILTNKSAMWGMENIMKRYGKGDEFGDFEKLALKNKAIIDAYNKKGDTGKSAADVIGTKDDKESLNGKINAISEDIKKFNDEIKKTKERDDIPQANKEAIITDQENRINAKKAEKNELELQKQAVLANAKIDTEIEKILNGFKEENYKNITTKVVLDDKFGDLIIEKILEKRPGTFGGLLSKAKTSEMEQLVEKFDDAQKRMLDTFIVKEAKLLQRNQIASISHMSAKEKIQFIEKSYKDGVPKDILNRFNKLKSMTTSTNKNISKRMYDYFDEDEKKDDKKGEKKDEGKK